LFGSLESLLGAVGIASGRTEPDADGWHNYLYTYPPKNILLQFERRVGLDSLIPQKYGWTGYADFGDYFNTANLYWRLTGIGKHQLEAA
jgi:hypothetical protein